MVWMTLLRSFWAGDGVSFRGLLIGGPAEKGVAAPGIWFRVQEDGVSEP